MPLSGEAYALCTALCFSTSSAAFAFASRAAGGLAANHFRLWAALPLLLALQLLLDGSPVGHPLSAQQWGLLLGSGLVGLVVGDVGYFHALAVIGPRLSSVVMASWPLFVVLGDTALGRPPSWLAFGGMLLLLLGIALVLFRGREASAWRPGLTRREFLFGLLGALVGALGQALGIMLARAGMAGASEELAVAPLQATLVRMTAAVVGMQAFLLLRRQPAAGLQVLRTKHGLGPALLGTCFGPVLGVWLSMLATRHAASTGVAAALMATVPVFMMPLSRLLYGARIGLLGVLGTLLVVGGAVLML